jgi:hypothetical protein
VLVLGLGVLLGGCTYWWLIGTARTVTISGDAIREIEE